MEKNILRVLGDLLALQTTFNLKSKYNGTLLESLLKNGRASYEGSLFDTKHYDDVARCLRVLGLEVKVEEAVINDPDRSYHKTEYMDGRIMTISLPTSPAIKVLYGKQNE